jgi:cytochrome c oxidase subunit 2
LDNELGTADDISMTDELHIEVGKTYHYKLTSKDVLHSFSVPVFRLKQDAIPGREIMGWFEATETSPPEGYSIQCAEMCGFGHGIMGARIYVETAEEHRAWMSAHSGVAALDIDDATNVE